MKRVSEIMGMAWPVVALTLVRRLSAQVDPKPPREAFSPANPAHAEAADENYVRLVKGAATRLGIVTTHKKEFVDTDDSGRETRVVEDVWMSMLTRHDWKRICHALAEAIDPDCNNCPHWPPGWRDAYERSKNG